MSDFNPDDYVAGPDGSLVEKTEATSAKWRRDLERRAKKGDEALKALESIQRELALTRAGIPDGPLGALFSKAYDGPIDDPEAIRAEWQKISPQQSDPRVAEALSGAAQAQDITAGAQAANTGFDLAAEAQKIKNQYKAPSSWEDGKQAAKQMLHQHFGPDILDKWGMTGRQT